MSFIVKAYHTEDKIVLNNIRKEITEYTLVRREYSFLLYQKEEQSYFYIKEYGSVVFINCNEEFITKIMQLCIQKKPKKIISENYTITIDNNVKTDFNTIYVPNIDIDTAHIIMLNLAQSVALKDYVEKTFIIYNKTLTYSKQLEETGRIKLSKQQMRKFIGKIMNLKNTIVENLFVFDSPELASKNETLYKLNEELRDELGTVERYQSVQNSLNTIKENLDLFKDILQHKYSSMLEWIIIILILFEVIQVIIEKAL